jgi:hypothetical protein
MVRMTVCGPLTINPKPLNMLCTLMTDPGWIANFFKTQYLGASFQFNIAYSLTTEVPYQKRSFQDASIF